MFLAGTPCELTSKQEEPQRPTGSTHLQQGVFHHQGISLQDFPLSDGPCRLAKHAGNSSSMLVTYTHLIAYVHSSPARSESPIEPLNRKGVRQDTRDKLHQNKNWKQRGTRCSGSPSYPKCCQQPATEGGALCPITPGAKQARKGKERCCRGNRRNGAIVAGAHHTGSCCLSPARYARRDKMYGYPSMVMAAPGCEEPQNKKERRRREGGEKEERRRREGGEKEERRRQAKET